MLQRRTAMKRTSSLKQGSSLKQAAPLRQGGSLKRGGSLRQGAPLKQGASLKQTGFVRKAPVRPPREERILRPAAALPAGGRRGVPARITDTVVAIPKQPREERPHLLEMARDKSCLFWFVAECRGSADASSTVHAHDNRLSANKGRGYKAHDWRGLRACFECHFAYDQGKKHSREEKNAAFDEAYERQLAVWREIAASRSADPRDCAAAQWALDRFEHFQRTRGLEVAGVPAAAAGGGAGRIPG